MRNPTRDDVAKYARVSGATVSRVMSGREELSISDETRIRVLEAAKRLGYHANHSARALASGQTGLIGLWINHLHTPFHSQIAHIIAFQNKPDRYRVLISELEAIVPSVNGYSDYPLVDGIIVHEGSEYIRSFLESSTTKMLPYVTMGASYLENGDYVGIDLFTGQIEAVKHLYALGCRRIAYVVNEDASQYAEARTSGYASVMADAGLPTEYIITPVKDQSRATARNVVRDYIERQGCPDAIICLNDDMAIDVNRALRDMNLRVPEDVSLVGCDGIDDTIYQVPTTTTIVQPVKQMCELALKYLENRIENPEIPPQQIILRSRLVIRESTRHII